MVLNSTVVFAAYLSQQEADIPQVETTTNVLHAHHSRNGHIRAPNPVDLSMQDRPSFAAFATTLHPEDDSLAQPAHQGINKSDMVLAHRSANKSDVELNLSFYNDAGWKNVLIRS